LYSDQDLPDDARLGFQVISAGDIADAGVRAVGGGLSSRELLALVRLTSGLQVVGADVVEVSPAYDHAEITAIAAAHVVYELVSVISGTERQSEHA
jgi:arginase family enzyme